MRFVRIVALLSTICADKIRAAGGENACLSDGRCISGGRTLNLSGCGLEDDDMDDIAECIADAQSVDGATLAVLRLNSNSLTNLTDSDVIQDLPDLERLYLSDNDLVEVPPLHGLPDLERLYLSDNDLAEVPPLQLELLYYLRLDNNHISSLGSDAFTGTPNVEQLFLSGNDLVEIPKHVLEFPNLFYLNLDDNHLTSFPSDMLEEETSSPIIYLYLMGNPALACAPTTTRESYIYVDEGIDDCAPPTPAPVPAPSPPAPAPGPETCSSLGIDGIDGENDGGSCCCPTGCGMCGGTGCRRFGLPGFDRYDCCIGKILESAQDCRLSGTAPCVVSYNT